ncbi:MAG: hypothetical protein Q3972_05875 [Corynebacterium sp.]|nr:hypothetical protein [Corynebacterium sp.]
MHLSQLSYSAAADEVVRQFFHKHEPDAIVDFTHPGMARNEARLHLKDRTYAVFYGIATKVNDLLNVTADPSILDMILGPELSEEEQAARRAPWARAADGEEVGPDALRIAFADYPETPSSRSSDFMKDKDEREIPIPRPEGAVVDGIIGLIILRQPGMPGDRFFLSLLTPAYGRQLRAAKVPSIRMIGYPANIYNDLHYAFGRSAQDIPPRPSSQEREYEVTSGGTTLKLLSRGEDGFYFAPGLDIHLTDHIDIELHGRTNLQALYALYTFLLPAVIDQRITIDGREYELSQPEDDSTNFQHELIQITSAIDGLSSVGLNPELMRVSQIHQCSLIWNTAENIFEDMEVAGRIPDSFEPTDSQIWYHRNSMHETCSCGHTIGLYTVGRDEMYEGEEYTMVETEFFHLNLFDDYVCSKLDEDWQGFHMNPSVQETILYSMSRMHINAQDMSRLPFVDNDQLKLLIPQAIADLNRNSVTSPYFVGFASRAIMNLWAQVDTNNSYAWSVYLMAKRRLGHEMDLTDLMGLQRLADEPKAELHDQVWLPIIKEDPDELREVLGMLDYRGISVIVNHPFWDFACRSPRLADVVLEYVPLLRPVCIEHWRM